MEFRNLGRSGLRVSVVGLGCNNFGGRLDVESTRRVVHRALDQGITLFDTADVYGNRGGSESQLGEVLGARRHDIVLATKFGMEMDDVGAKQGASRTYVIKAVDDSLRRLRTDYIDLYQLHTPDPRTPLEETLRALDDLVRQGKVRYIGCSNFDGWQIADAAWIARSERLTPFISVQNEYSLLERNVESEVVPAATRFGLGLLPFFPLAGGLLSGKYKHGAAVPKDARLADAKRFGNRFLTERNWAIVDELQALADELGQPMLELAIGWLASRPGVASVIAGATKPEQIEANVAAGGVRLDAQVLARIEEIAHAARA